MRVAYINLKNQILLKWQCWHCYAILKSESESHAKNLNFIILEIIVFWSYIMSTIANLLSVDGDRSIGTPVRSQNGMKIFMQF